MRRSRTVTLTLLAGTGLAVAACDSEPAGEGVLESRSACVQELGAAVSECDAVFRSARATHAATAPRFPSAEACREAVGGECADLAEEPRDGRGLPWAGTPAAVFIPVMAGVMIGRALSDGSRGATPVYAGRRPPDTACPPEMQGREGCPPASTASGSGGGHYWYSGSSYAGYSGSGGSGGYRPASASPAAGGAMARNAQAVSSASRSGVSASRSGGLGLSAAAHSGGGS